MTAGRMWANIVETLAHRPWGIYEMTVVDLDENEFRFTCPSPETKGPGR